jgi:hypothetical protein
VFIPPGSAAAWGTGGGGGEDSGTCRSTQSADSMGTPQSHFKARPPRVSSKRALGESILLLLASSLEYIEWRHSAVNGTEIRQTDRVMTAGMPLLQSSQYMKADHGSGLVLRRTMYAAWCISEAHVCCS